MSTSTDIWSNLSEPWRCCLEDAWQAYSHGSLPIAALVVDQDGRIVARGRNRIHEAVGETGHLHGHVLAHAELNALMNLDHRRLDRHRSVLYSALEPCPMCLGAFYMSGLRQLRYAARDPYAGSVDMLGSTTYLSKKQITVIGPENATVEDVLVALNVEATLRDGHHDRAEFLVRQWNRAVPAGVALGRALAAEKWFGREAQLWASFKDVLGELIPRGARVKGFTTC